ncbi:MAG: hypothetical protein FJ148_21390 [Deltaproteobacteria bacterium]|nr:hypothetical protein [Deltaproteobacteria bacterium]
MVRVPLEFAKPTMRLAKPICDAKGRVLAGSGSLLTPSVVRLLRRLAIQTVVVTGGDDDIAGWEAVRSLADERRLLETRMGKVVPRSARAMLQEALDRRLARRDRRLGSETDG